MIPYGMFTVLQNQIPANPLECGADAGIRAPDPLITNQLVSPNQRAFAPCLSTPRRRKNVEAARYLTVNLTVRGCA